MSADVKTVVLGALLTGVASLGAINLNGCGQCVVTETGQVDCSGQIPVPAGE